MKLFNDAFDAPDTSNSYAIGSTVNFGTFAFKVDGCGYNKTLRISEDTEKRAEGIYLVILLDYTNMSHQPQIINGAEFTLADGDGNVYVTSSEGMKALALGNNKIVDVKECPPKVHKVGYLCFEVPRKDIYYLLVPSKNGMNLKASIKLPER